MIGIIVLCLVGVLVLVVLIAAVRTFFIQLPPAGERPAVDETASLRHAERLAEMIRVPSVSKNADDDLSEFDALHRVLERLFPRVHAALEKTELSGTLIFRWAGSDPSQKPILFMAHQDVVPAPDEGWTYPPFSGTIADGKLYGRGTLDSKCNIYAQLEAVEQLLCEGFTPPCDVYIEMAINEETGGDGAPSAARYLEAHGVFPELVLDEGGTILERVMPGMDRPFAVIGVGEKGYLDVKFTAKGYGGHSSTPPKRTPIARLSAMVSDIERRSPFKSYLSPAVGEMLTAISGSFGYGMRLLLGNLWLFRPLVTLVMPAISGYGAALLKTTCTFTMSGGSDACNVIPAEAFVIANLRTAAHQGVDETLRILGKYAKKYDLTMTVLQRRDASPFADTKGKAYADVVAAIRARFPDIGVTPYLVLGGTDARHFYSVCDSPLRFSPIRMDSKQEKSCHGVDENVTAAALTEAVGFYKYFVTTHR